mgnify:CR=1 FL=1
MIERRGRFEITMNIINQYPWIAKRVMSQCIIVRAERMYMRDSIEYHAISHKFDLVQEGEIIPAYYWKYSPENDIEAMKLETLGNQIIPMIKGKL